MPEQLHNQIFELAYVELEYNAICTGRGAIKLNKTTKKLCAAFAQILVRRFVDLTDEELKTIRLGTVKSRRH